MEKIQFSIVTVCYNASLTIRNTIKSVLAQCYDNYEYWIIDGASTDSTIEIIKSINDKHIKYISEPDNGIYDAMNKALNKAKGDYILFLGADDILFSKETLKNIENKITDDTSIIYGNVIKLSTGTIYDGEFTKWDWTYKNICHQAILYPKCIYKKKTYNLEYKLVADWVYNLELLAESVNFRYIDEIVSVYNDIDGLSSTKVDKKFLKLRRRLFINAVGFFPYLWGIFKKIKNKIL